MNIIRIFEKKIMKMSGLENKKYIKKDLKKKRESILVRITRIVGIRRVRIVRLFLKPEMYGILLIY